MPRFRPDGLPSRRIRAGVPGCPRWVASPFAMINWSSFPTAVLHRHRRLLEYAGTRFKLTNITAGSDRERIGA